MLREKELKRRFAETAQQYEYNFDNTFGPQVNTQEIYVKIGRPILNGVIEGYNGSLFVYGQTTSGKTFTMLGNSDIPGILPCTLKDLFSYIQSDSDIEYRVSVSYLEIYNEIINDLLVPGSSNLKIKDDHSYGVIVQGAKRQQIWNFDQAIILMNYGEEHRCYKETSLHEHSSRSHTIFQVYLESNSKNSVEAVRYSCLNLVDLAGSERLNEFDIRQNTVGETGYINRSLFVLSNVIQKLSEGKATHIPYRDSKLTRILSMALGGNSLTAVICTISPAFMNFHQTLSTLKFAMRAKTIKNNAKKNEFSNSNGSIKFYKTEIARLKDELTQKLLDIAQSEKEKEVMRQQLGIQSKQNANLLSKVKGISNSETPQDIPGNDAFYTNEFANREMNFMENLIFFIESVVASSESDVGIDDPNWVEDTQKLISTYKIELLNIQNKYRDILRDLTSKMFKKCYNQIYSYLTTINAHTIVPNLQDTETDELLTKIKEGKIFNDIESSATNLQNKIQNASPQEALNQLNNYKAELMMEADRLYDDVKHKLEGYYRAKVREKQAQINESQGFPDAANLIKITNSHMEMLHNVRSQYEHWQQTIIAEINTISQKISSYINEEIAPEADTDVPEPLGMKSFNSINHPTDQLMSTIKEIAIEGLEEKENKIKSKVPPNTEIKSQEGSLMKKLGGYKMFIWGSGKDGRCGNGKETGEKVPRLIDGVSFKAISCGYNHTAAINSNGSLMTWGRGIFGQLGHGNNENICSPKLVEALQMTIMKEVYCGWQHTLALSENGAVYSWGFGEDGQLGNGTNSDLNKPYEIKFFNGKQVSHIACGHSHSSALLEGKLYMWGNNTDKRLMIDDTTNKYTPTLIDHCKKIDIPILEVSLGVNHSAFINSNGNLYTGGCSEFGQLGVEPNEAKFICTTQVKLFSFSRKAKKVSCGEAFTLVIDGNVVM